MKGGGQKRLRGRGSASQGAEKHSGRGNLGIVQAQKGQKSKTNQMGLKRPPPALGGWLAGAGGRLQASRAGIGRKGIGSDACAGGSCERFVYRGRWVARWVRATAWWGQGRAGRGKADGTMNGCRLLNVSTRNGGGRGPRPSRAGEESGIWGEWAASA